MKDHDWEIVEAGFGLNRGYWVCRQCGGDGGPVNGQDPPTIDIFVGGSPLVYLSKDCDETRKAIDDFINQYPVYAPAVFKNRNQSTLKDFMASGKAAGADALGIAYDLESVETLDKIRHERKQANRSAPNAYRDANPTDRKILRIAAIREIYNILKAPQMYASMKESLLASLETLLGLMGVETGILFSSFIKRGENTAIGLRDGYDGIWAEAVANKVREIVGPDIDCHCKLVDDKYHHVDCVLYCRNS